MSTPEFAAVEETSGASNKRVVIAGGVAAALVLAYGGHMLLSGGSDNQALVIPLKKHHVSAQAAKAAGVSAKPASAAKIPAPSTVKLGRDPFLALYVVPAPVVAPVAPSGSVTPTGSVTPLSPSTGNGAGSGAGAGAPAGRGPVASSTYAVKLTRVYGTGSDQTAQFLVRGKTQLARVGAVFGASQELKLLSLQQNAKGVWIAVLQVGDAEPFDALAGQAYYVL